MPEPDERTTLPIEQALSELYAAPRPGADFARRLRGELLARARRPSWRSRLAGFWSGLHAAGRWGLSLAGAALAVALILLSVRVLPVRLPSQGAVDRPAGAAVETAAPGSTMTVPAPAVTPAVEESQPVSTPDLPLAPGTTWTYEMTRYEQAPGDPAGRVTATNQVVERVVEIVEEPPFTAARVQREETRLRADPGWVDGQTIAFFPAAEFWYVVRDGEVYLSDDRPDLANFRAEEHELLYRLPLAVGQSWCPRLDKGSAEGATPTPIPGITDCEYSGKRTVERQVDVETALGTLSGCYEISESFTSGGVWRWFCPGVGLAQARYDHGGSPYGFMQSLTGFYLPGEAPPPGPSPTPDRPLGTGVLLSMSMTEEERQRLPGLELVLETALPESPARVMTYRQTGLDVPLTAERARAVAAQLGIQGEPEELTGEGGETIYKVTDGQHQVLVFSDSPLFFSYAPAAQEAMTVENPPPFEAQALAAEAFLREHGLLGSAYRVERVFPAAWRDRAVAFTPLLGEAPLVENDLYNPRIQVAQSAAGWNPWVVYEAITVEPAGETEIRSAEAVWADLAAHRLDPYVVFRFLTDGEPGAEVDGRATVHQVELAYFTATRKGMTVNAIPQDWAARAVVPVWRFTGVMEDGRQFELVAEAAPGAAVEPSEQDVLGTPAFTATPTVAETTDSAPIDQPAADSVAIPAAAAAVSPRACQAATAYTAHPNLPIRPAEALGGGVMGDGDFQIGLWLTCNPAYHLQAAQNPSEIDGLAIRAGFLYNGPRMEGMTTDFYGIEPFASARGGYGSALEPDYNQYTEVGILAGPGVFPDFSGNDFRLRFIYKLRDPAGRFYGAVLAFRLVREADGFVPREIEVLPLSPAERAAGFTQPDAPLPFPLLDPARIHPLLGEMRDLSDRGQAALIPEPARAGWVVLRELVNQPGQQAALPDGTPFPAEFRHEMWHRLDEQGAVTAAVLRTLRPDGTALRESRWLAGAWRDLTFGGDDYVGDLRPPSADQFSYLYAAQAVRHGATLYRADLPLEGDRRGMIFTVEDAGSKKETVYDRDTGALRLTRYSEKDENGGWRLVSSSTVLAYEWLDRVPEEIELQSNH